MADINIGQITEALNNKLDRDGMNAGNPASVVIETYSNETSWYRVYSDGWCEQGGTVEATSNIWVTITLLKPYINTNYNLQGGSKILDSSYPNNALSVSFRNYTQTTFETAVHDDETINKGTWTWQACGYIN